MPELSIVSEVAVLISEEKLLTARKADIAMGPSKPADSPDAATTTHWGLALSGGGIRSATFSLGVLQAITETHAAVEQSEMDAQNEPAGATFRRSLLSRFDYMSTVSGGGYIGAFVCSLFQPNRLRDQAGSKWQAADDAVKVLTSGPPGRIHSNDKFADDSRLRAPLAWLRENGRYLVPTGVGDAVYAGALGVRNWVALHFVVGTVILMILSAAELVRAGMSQWSLMQDWEKNALNLVPEYGTVVDRIWWSPFFAVALIPLMLFAVPFGFAYWLSYDSKNGKVSPFNDAVAAGVLAVVILLLSAYLDNACDPAKLVCILTTWDGLTLSPRQLLWLITGAIASLGICSYIITSSSYPLVTEQRVRLTRYLASSLIVMGIVIVVAVIDTIGQSLYLWSRTSSPAGPALTPAAFVAVLVWLTKKGAAYFNKPHSPTFLQNVPLTTLAGIAGVLIFMLVAVTWSLAINWLMWKGAKPVAAELFAPAQVWFLCALMVMTFALAVLTGYFPGFINLSSLQPFYSARLTRAYLGASNGERFDGGVEALSAAEPLPKDNLSLDSFVELPEKDKLPGVARLKTLAPLHIINVTLNKTVDPAEQLVQRDRKGQPLAVLPFCFSVDGHLMSFRNDLPKTEIERPLSLGQWIGTSGAAFSTGIGRETSLGMSLLMGAANVRLGTWWQSGRSNRKTTPNRIKQLAAKLFATQTYLSYELRARFFGMRREWQYLSDGGHFENTAIYELLRPSREVGVVIASDNGADPTYCFDDLANLIRLARIDFRVEVSVLCDFKEWPELDMIFGTVEDFIPAEGGPMHQSEKHRSVCALLLKAAPIGSPRASTWIVLIKPTVTDDAPADIQQYARTHPRFPQEPTTDQFFDEAQWESYRSLGHFNTSKILEPRRFAALQQYIACDGVRQA